MDSIYCIGKKNIHYLDKDSSRAFNDPPGEYVISISPAEKPEALDLQQGFQASRFALELKRLVRLPGILLSGPLLA